MKEKLSTVFWVLIRFFLGAVFMVSGFMKLIKPANNFFSVIESYQILKGPVATTVALVVPWFELIFGVFLIVGLWLRQSVTVLWCLNMVFIAVLSSAILRKLPLESCGCFGEALSLKPSHMLAFDLALWALFALSIISLRRMSALSLDRFFDK